MPAAAMLGGKLARAEDRLKWAVFTPDSEVTFRTVMKPFAETVQRESDNAVVFDEHAGRAIARRGESEEIIKADLQRPRPDFLVEIGLTPGPLVGGRAMSQGVVGTEQPLERRAAVQASRTERYARMVEIRLVEESVLKLFGEGLIPGTTHTCQGQEAV